MDDDPYERVFFMDQTNGMVHGIYSSNETPDEESPAKWEWVPDGKGGGTFTLNISTFGPDSPNEWTYGDVLMAQLTTDRKTVTTFFTGAKYMSYEPVSSGYAVISDPDYVPATFDYDIDSMAEMFDIEPVSDEDGDLLGDDKRASFGAFPYIGEITAAIHVFSFIASSATHNSEMNTLMKDLNSMSMGEKEEEGLIDAEGNLLDWGDDESVGADSATDGKGGTPQRLKLSILVKFDETFYGGVLFMLGVIVAYGGGKAYQKTRNPFQTFQTMKAESKMLDADINQAEGPLLGSNDSGISSNALSKERISEFGGLHFEFHAYVGIYIDFGYIELKELDSNGNPQKSHDAVFMGAGGFIGFGGNIGYTWAFMLAFLPAYINAEAGLDLTVFLGASADPNKTLDEYEKLDDFKDKSQVHAQDYSFNFDFKGRIYVSVTFGIGLYKIIGVRVTGEVAFEFGYSNKVVDWWPELFDSGWGYVMEAGFAGTIDLIVTSIDLYSASWPLPVGGGYLRYFQELRRANKCISYVEKGISDGHGSQADRDTAYQMCRELEIMVDQMTASREEIEAKTKELKNYAYDHEIITWTTKNAIEMNKQGGLVGTANVTAVGSGTTTLTATVLPSGRKVEIEVRVDGGAQENPFEDVEEGRFFYDAVLWAYYHDPQITSGITDTTFSPYGEATRGQVVTFLYRAAGNPEPKSGDNPFTDVEEGRFYYDAVLWAAGEGITNGKTDTSFSPGEPCTRGEFVTFLYRFAGKPDVALTENPFEDVSAERFYYKPVLWAVEQNVTTGTSATTFSPNKNCTRGEIVTFLYRYMGRE